MKNYVGQLFYYRVLLIAALLAVLTLPVRGQSPPVRPSSGIAQSNAGTYSNLISFTLGAPSIDGSKAQYMQRQRVPSDVFGGLENLHLEQFVGAQGILTFDGRAIPANDEYRFKLNVEAPDVGFARAGIDNFRVRYDGAAGYFIPTSKQFEPMDATLAMDRGDTWIEGGLRVPTLPDITLKYTRRFRDGTKPSLSWGDSQDLDDFGTRNISPSFWLSDEVRNMFDADVRDTFGKTTLFVNAHLESGDIENSLNIWRRPLEEGTERFITDQETVDSDALRINAGAVTALGNNVHLSLNYVHENMDSDFGGGRIYGDMFGAMFDPTYTNRQRRDHGFLDVDGTNSRTLNSGSLNLRYNAGDFTLVPTIRIEQMDLEGDLDVTDTEVEADGSITQTPIVNTSDRSVTDFTASLELRYTGVQNMTLYARGDLTDRNGDLFEEELDEETSTVEFERQTDDSRKAQRYLVGANWHASTKVRISAQAYRKIRSIDYDHIVNADGPLTYPGFLQTQDFETNDMNVQIRLQPDPRFTLNGRFDIRRTITEGTAEGLDEYRSSEITGRVFTGSVHAAPIRQMYIKGYVTASKNRILTPINELTGDVADIVLEARGDYFSAYVTIGGAVSEKANLEGGYFYLNADNFIDNSMVGLPYDISAQENGLSAEASYELKPGLTGSIRYYYYINRDDTFGGTQDYDLNLVYIGVSYRF